jgi:CRISPR-associated protein Cas1
LRQEALLVKQGELVLQEVQLPLLEQILVFGKSQLTTQVIRACLWRNISVAYLSRMGFCYGRLIGIEQGYRQLVRYQQEIAFGDRLLVARTIVQAKLKNSRVLLLRQQQKQGSARITTALEMLEALSQQVKQVYAIEQLMGLEGAGAATYFAALGDCISNSGFRFASRSRRPPADPVNALLSFGYQVLWNHLLVLIEMQGLDPYYACLHQGSERHAALASDLVEEFRAPIVDSLMLYLVNRGMVVAERDFEYRDDGCFLNDSGRKIFLRAFVQRMEERLQINGEAEPRWELLNRQVRAYKAFVYSPAQGYSPYLIR